MKTTLMAALLVPVFLSACASQAQRAAAPTQVSDGVLAGTNGMTLYIFDKDVADSGKSVCNGKCAENWPPLKANEADGAAGDYTVIARDDGSRQWAYRGKPLYFWIKDQKLGDRTGDGFNGVWRLAKP